MKQSGSFVANASRPQTFNVLWIHKSYNVSNLCLNQTHFFSRGHRCLSISVSPGYLQDCTSCKWEILCTGVSSIWKNVSIYFVVDRVIDVIINTKHGLAPFIESVYCALAQECSISTHDYVEGAIGNPDCWLATTHHVMPIVVGIRARERLLRQDRHSSEQPLGPNVLTKDIHLGWGIRLRRKPIKRWSGVELSKSCDVYGAILAYHLSCDVSGDRHG